MKRFLLTTFAFISILSAGEFEDAEALFQQGKFKECDEKIGKALETKLSAPQKLKLQAMREYIWGNNPDKITENVKKAQEIAAHRGWLTNDLLNHSTLLIRRAEDWKSRGIPEYQELSNAAAKLLAQLKDGGNPEIAIKQVILQTKNFNLNGEYHEPMKLIRNVLRLYYPTKRNSREGKSSGEVELLILLGEQYAGLGVATRNEREKVNALSSCAQYYLEAIKYLPANSARYQDLSDRLCFGRETLRLLGYNLRLPTKIKPQKSIATAMIDEMLRTRRFQDVVIALESKKEPAMRLRYAAALCAIGQSDKAVTVAKELNEIKEPHWILQAARHSLASGKKEDAAFFFQRFLELSPNSPDASNANRQYVAILMEQHKYEEGAAAFLQQAKLSSDPKQKDDAVFQAAQCYYQGKKYLECINLFPGIDPTPEHNLLLAQANIHANNISVAYRVLTSLLAEKTLDHEMRLNVMKLAIFCAMKESPKDAINLLEQFLKAYPKDAETSEYTRHLLALYVKENAPPAKFERLANDFLNNFPKDSNTVPLVLACAERISDMQSKEKLLRRLLEQKDFSIAELNVLLRHLPTLALKRDFLNRYKKPFANTPEDCALYFQMAEIEFSLKNFQEALNHIEKLLQQPEVFRYKDCKRLQIEANAALKNENTVRKCCQELLLSELTAYEKRSVVLSLAQSWERSGEPKKAIANVWTAVPLDGKSCDPKDRQVVLNLLELIIRNAKKTESSTDLQDAEEVLLLVH